MGETGEFGETCWIFFQRPKWVEGVKRQICPLYRIFARFTSSPSSHAIAIIARITLLRRTSCCFGCFPCVFSRISSNYRFKFTNFDIDKNAFSGMWNLFDGVNAIIWGLATIGGNVLLWQRFPQKLYWIDEAKWRTKVSEASEVNILRK